MAIASTGTTESATRLTELYEAHATAMFRFALHMTGRREDAEDVVQYVFTQAFRLLEAGEQILFPRAWLMQATRNRALNLIRRVVAAPAGTLDLEAATLAPADAAEREELAQVRAMLWTLPESQHQAFVLRHWSGLSQNEIADVLETTPTAVESLLTRARSTLLEARQSHDPRCADALRRLVNALQLTSAQRVHLGSCRRCRAAQQRLSRATGFAAVIFPTPQMMHVLRTAIPGFSPSLAAAEGGAATGSAAGLGGGGAGGTLTSAGTASHVAAAAKLSLAAKVAIVAVTATAVAATPPVRHSLTVAAHDAAAAIRSAPGRTQSPAEAAVRSAPRGSTAGGAPDTSTTVDGNGSTGHAYGRQRGAHAPATAAHGRSAKHGARAAKGNGAAHGQVPVSAPVVNGQGHAKAKTNGNSSAAGGSAKTTPPANSNAGGNGKSNAGGNGKSNAGGNGSAAGNGKGHQKA